MYRIVLLAMILTSSLIPRAGHAQNAEPPYEMNHLQAYSLFYENYRTKQYDLALQFGRWMLVAQPRVIEGNPQFSLDKQYERFVDIYSAVAREEADPTVRAAYYDTVKTLFQTVNEIFTDEEVDRFQWKITKGQFYQQNYASIPGALDSTYASYQEAFDLDAERLTEISDGYYARLLIENYTTRRQKEKALEIISIVEPLASPSLMQVIDSSRDRLFDSPGERIDYLKTKVEAEPENQELLNELADLLADNDRREEAIALRVTLYELNPDYQNTLLLGRIEASDAKYERSNQYLIEALDKAPDEEERKTVAMDISRNFQSLENLQSARRYARQASSIDPQWDQPYRQIASIYAAAVSSCTQSQGRSIEREDRTVYWLVLDYLDRVKSVNPSQPSSFSRTYSQYEAVMPTTEDKFFNGWTTGESFRIDGGVNQCYGWINESTTIR